MTNQKHAVSRRIPLLILAVVACMGIAVPAHAGEAPITAINKFSDLFFSAIQAVGLILVGYGLIQIGISLKNQDASQRSQAILALVGGLFIVFAKNLVQYLVG